MYHFDPLQLHLTPSIHEWRVELSTIPSPHVGLKIKASQACASRGIVRIWKPEKVRHFVRNDCNTSNAPLCIGPCFGTSIPYGRRNIESLVSNATFGCKPSLLCSRTYGMQKSVSFNALDNVGRKKMQIHRQNERITYLWHATILSLYRSYQSRNRYLLLQQQALNGEEPSNQ